MSCTSPFLVCIRGTKTEERGLPGSSWLYLFTTNIPRSEKGEATKAQQSGAQQRAEYVHDIYFHLTRFTLPDVAAHFHVGGRQQPLCGSGPDNVWQGSPNQVLTHASREGLWLKQLAKVIQLLWPKPFARTICMPEVPAKP